MRAIIVTRAATIAIVAAIVAACGGAPSAGGPAASGSPSATASAAPVKLKASYGNVSPANLAPFYAKEKGIFLKHGLDVDLSLIDGGAKSMAALLGNSVDVAQLGGTETMSAFVGGGDVVALALFVPVSPWVLMAPSTYKTPADLKGKVVGVASKGGSSEIAAQLCLQRLGLQPSDVTILATGSVANLTAAMLAGQVYAGPGHPPDTAALIKANYKVIVDLAAEKVLATDNVTTVTRQYLSTHKDVLQRYVDSLIEAIAAMKKDKAGTIPVMQKLLNVDDQAALAQTYDYYVTAIFPTYPTPDPNAFKSSRDELAKTNAAVKDLDVTKVIDSSFVDDAKKRNVGGN